MKKKIFTMLLVVLLVITTSSVALADQRQKNINNARDAAEERIAEVSLVSWQDLRDNEEYYKGKIVKIKSMAAFIHADLGVAVLATPPKIQNKTFKVKMTTYRYKADTEYTIVGEFTGFTELNDGSGPFKAAQIIEETHTPYMSEYGF